MTSLGTYSLEVIGGEDHGTVLALGDEPVTIGRANDSSLVLRDPGVSRQHLTATPTHSGVRFEACDGAAPFLKEGVAHRSVDAQLGDRILVGNTILVVAVANGAPAGGMIGATDVRTALTGVGADARAMSALYALIDTLDEAVDVESLDRALLAWASGLSPSCTVQVLRGTREPEARGVTVREESGETLVSIPAPGDEPASLIFRCSIPAERVTESFRRMLVLAGRLLGSALARARRLEFAGGEVAQLRAMTFGSGRAFLGTSPAAQQLAERLPRLAASDVSVLIEGETGVGKTFVARLLHESSARSKEPLRIINCAAIPETLLESELFGHERGAFTGAVATRIGAMEAAGRGTIFLDEVGELSLAAQAKLLHVVEERKFERLGSNRSVELRARIVCATNRDLAQMVSAGRFRQDLLFRLAVVRIRVPALRERTEDLPQLAAQLLGDAASTAGRRVTGFSAEALDLLRGYAWPGNVRELRNVLEHALALGDGPIISTNDLPSGLASVSVQPDEPMLVKLPLDLATLERRAIQAALLATGGNRVSAAVLLGIPRSTLYYRLKEYGITDGERAGKRVV